MVKSFNLGDRVLVTRCINRYLTCDGRGRIVAIISNQTPDEPYAEVKFDNGKMGDCYFNQLRKLYELKLISYSTTKIATNICEIWEFILNNRNHISWSTLACSTSPQVRRVISSRGLNKHTDSIIDAMINSGFEQILRSSNGFISIAAEPIGRTAECKKCGGTGKVVLFQLPIDCECVKC